MHINLNHKKMFVSKEMHRNVFIILVNLWVGFYSPLTTVRANKWARTFLVITRQPL